MNYFQRVSKYFISLYVVLATFPIIKIYGQDATFSGIEIKSYPKNEISKVFKDFKVYELNSQAFDGFVKSADYNSQVRLNFGNNFDWDMTLFESDLRSDNYLLRVVTENGIKELPKGKNITYQGYLNNDPESHIRLTIKDNFIYGFVRQKGLDAFIEPAIRFLKNAKKNQYIIYYAKDVVPDSGVKCGVSDLNKAKKKHSPKEDQKSAGVLACLRLELAIASDFSYMIARGGDVGDAVSAAIAVMNNVQGDFTSSFNDNIEFEIVEQFVSACASCDPWTNSTNAGTLLSDFLSWGNDSGFTIGTGYDLGQLWTARDICSSGCGTVGLAYVGVVCGNSRYHLLEDFSTNANSLRVLTSHEIGHNFNMIHDAANSGFIMAPSVNNTSTWSPASIDIFNAYVPGLSCLNACAVPSCTPVTDLNIVELNSGSPQLQLSWTANVAGNYRIRVREEGGSNNIFSMSTSSTNLSIDPGMEMCRTYEVIVESFCGGNNYSTPVVGLIENQTVPEPNDITVTNCSSSTTIALSSTLTVLETFEVIGWWITEDQPINNTITNGNKSILLASANLESGLANPVNHIYEASNAPSQDYSLTIDCSALNDTKNYYATPFVSNKKPEISDVSCSVNATIFNGTFNSRPARYGSILSNEICRPASPPNLPNYSYALTVSGFTGNASNHYLCIFSGGDNDCFVQLSGNGSYTIPSSASIPDPGIDGLEAWVWEEGGGGMANATISVTLNITYPGCTAINFPDISVVDICSIGDAIQINCSCAPPCSISSLSAGPVTCSSDNAVFSMSFSVANGSGSYEVVNASNTVVGSGNSSPISVTVSGPTSAGNQDFRVRDANNLTCISSPVSVSLPTCILPCNAASPAIVNGTISSDTMRTKTFLTSTADVNAGNVKFQARDSIMLNANFEVSTSGVFEVQIGDCVDNP